jgi:hypothetical protein
MMQSIPVTELYILFRTLGVNYCSCKKAISELIPSDLVNQEEHFTLKMASILHPSSQRQ